MKAGWPLTTLADLTKDRPICYGVLKPGERQTEGVRLIRITDIRENYLDPSDLYLITDELSAEFKRSILMGGEILLSIQGTIGRVALCPDEYAGSNISRTIALIDPDERVDRSFLRYFLLSMEGKFPTGGATRASLNISDIRKIAVPLPPLEQQRRIVAVLDEAFEGLARARENTEANLASARELFESHKTNVLAQTGSDSEEVLLSEVADIVSGLVDPREKAYEDFLHLGAGNMTSGSDELVEVKTAREEKLKSGKYLFDQKAVLYSKIRPYLRKAARPDFSGLCSADVYPITPSPEKLTRDFLFHLLLSHEFTEYAISGSNRAGMPKVNRNHLFAYRFKLPPLAKQQLMALAIDQADIECRTLTELYRTKLQDLDDLRQSLLRQAFAGELT
ncbi:restriction endonuclease subunit S [Henriciella litoralis]|uniref:restriction endonuclease subunit S n=1 Tax=Henriciella litoralis TaxID=568102 RepID=UPI0009FFCE70|nr:restriction endonuclease subunit S [Henriciella litoralis]